MSIRNNLYINGTGASMQSALDGYQDVRLFNYRRGNTDRCYRGHSVEECKFDGLPEDDLFFCSVCREPINNGSDGAQCRQCFFYLCLRCLHTKAECLRDMKKFFSEVRLLAEAENIFAQFDLGLCFINGDCVEQDHSMAANWLKFAADKGHAQSQFMLGRCYTEGKSLKKSYSKALNWFLLAADQNCDAAEKKLKALQVTEMHLAAVKGDIDFVNMVLSSSSGSTDINAKDMHLRQPLHMAAANGHIRVCQALLAARADMEAQDITPIALAAADGHADVVHALIVNRAAIDVKDRHSGTPLHSAACGNNVDVFKALLDAKADIHAKDALQRTPLHLACRTLDVVQVLLDCGADVEATDEKGKTALLCASSDAENPDVIAALLNVGADIEAKDMLQQTVLHYCATSRNKNVVQALLDAGADINAKDKNGISARKLAQKSVSGDETLLWEWNANFFATGGPPTEMLAISYIRDAFEKYRPDFRALRLAHVLDRKLQQPGHLNLHELPSICWVLKELSRYTYPSGVGRSQTTSIKLIYHLNIAGNNISCSCTTAIARHIRQQPAITSFDVSNNPELGVLGLVRLVEALPISIRKLNIRNTGLGISKEILGLLTRFTALSDVDISQNPGLSLLETMTLFQSLPVTLKSLYICNMDLNGCRDVILQEYLSRFSGLTHLDISETSGFSDRDMSALLRSAPTSLKSLTMRNLNFNLEPMSIVESLQHFKSLELLNLSDNHSKDESFDPIVDSCCRFFPGLQTLILSNIPSLYSLPDSLLDLKSLNSIVVDGCEHLEYPPLRIWKQGFLKIKDYLARAQKAEPLKKCKVVFLGNGRSGKTSLLRALAKLPFNDDEASTQGVSVTHDFSEKLQPDFIRKCAGAPDLHFWDFAGQLEYSAAHEFFMSNRQAVYVIIFSAVDDREAQVHQVTYWLRTVLTRDVSCVRIVIVGTKIDKIKGDLSQELKDIERLMQRSVTFIVQKVAPFCKWSVLVKFVTSVSSHPEFEKRRVSLKGHIFDLSMDIFKGKHRMLRFPIEYKDIIEDVKQMRQKLNLLKMIPIFELSDPAIVTREYKHLYDAHTNSMKQEALKILGDVGDVIYYEIKDSPWICLQPQLIGSVIAVFADPCRLVKPLSSRQEIFSLLDEFSSDQATRQKLFDFLVALKIVIQASDQCVDELYLIPLAFKGRPAFWSDVVDIKEVRALRGIRFSSQRMVSVASFVRVMSSMCSHPRQMWGCAFFHRLNDTTSVFVRLAESRSVVDCVVIGSPGELSNQQIDSHLQSIALQLGCDSRLHTFLCPQCCQSDIFMRSGHAHAFHFASSEAKTLNTQCLLNCSSYHSPSLEGVKHGVSVTMASTAETLLTDDALRSQLPWVEVITGIGILMFGDKNIGLTTTFSSSASDGVGRHFKAGDSIYHADISATPLEEVAESSLEPPAMLEFRGKLLPNSFFVLSRQLQEGDVLDDESLRRLLDVISDGDGPVEDVNVRALRRTNGFDAIVEQLNVKTRYNVFDTLCGSQIDMILSLSRAFIVQNTVYLDLGVMSVTAASPHCLQKNAHVFLSVSKSNGGCVLCRVTDVVSDIEFKVLRAEHNDQPIQGWDNDQPIPHCVGAKMMPCESSFGPNDNVLVIYKLQAGNRKPKFDLFPGRSEGLALAEITPADCFNSTVAACWRDIENHWELMLGTEFKNYEMTRVTMFLNRSREELLFRELNDLKASAVLRSGKIDMHVASDATPVDIERRRQLQDQTMGHFKEFSEKFGLFPKEKNKDVNLSVAWWGKSPSAYFSNAQHGFVDLPSQLKLDEGYFGDGFYLTQYPRYSDYYTSGGNLSSRKMQNGHIMLCYVALGKPYPVTQDPFDPPKFQGPPSSSSLYGKRCGPQCGGAGSHDCHYASVKWHSDAKQFYPCPLRQQPDFDEIVLFNPNRILPVAYVSYQRRRKTLLWLDDRPENDDNLRIRSKMLGAQWYDEIELTEQRQVILKAVVAEKVGVASVSISAVTGPCAQFVNGVYSPTSEKHCRRPVYLKGDYENQSTSMWIEYDEMRQQWQVKDLAHRGNGGWALASITTSRNLDDCYKSGLWKVAAAFPSPNADRISYKMNEASPQKREDQVDLTVFKSVKAMTAFLSDNTLTKFAEYPSSLFRIISNRRLFLGTVPIFCYSQSEFQCDGLSALFSVGDELMFEGDGLLGGVAPGVTYFLAAVRKSVNREFFSVSNVKGGAIISLKPRALLEIEGDSRSVAMTVRAPQRSLLHFLETSDTWRHSYPAICVFHGHHGRDELHAVLHLRPNTFATCSEETCSAFAVFEPMMALQETN